MNNLLQHEKLIKKAAWASAKKCGLLPEYEDVLQESYIAALSAIKRYNPELGAVSTFLWNTVHFTVLNYYSRQEQISSIPEDFDIPVSGGYEFPLWYYYLTAAEKKMVKFSISSGLKKTEIIKHFARVWGARTALNTAASIKNKLEAVI